VHSQGATSAKSPLLASSGTGDLFDEKPVTLPTTTLGEHVVHDYPSISLSLKAHPISFFREELAGQGVITSARHWEGARQDRARRLGRSCHRQLPKLEKEHREGSWQPKSRDFH
jgi:hypothetical protein